MSAGSSGRWRLRSVQPAEGRKVTARARRRAADDHEALGRGLGAEALRLRRAARLVPAQLGRRAPRDALAAPARRARTARRAAVSPSRVRRSSTSPTLRACSRRAAKAASASRSGIPGRIGCASSPRSAASREHVVRRVAVAAGELLVGVLRARPPRAPASSASTGMPSGISRVRQGASRPSRSTSRSTAIFAIRRQVVSLPPVIVTMPLEVSYSSALREMSTDFLRVAGGDQRPHARVGARDVARRRCRSRRTR